jgi:hypothetical protein
MHRTILLALLLPLSAVAQTMPELCGAAIPVDITGQPYLPKSARAHATVRIACDRNAEPPPPPQDILHGTAPGSDLLRGDGPKDLLANRWQTRVTVTTGK